MIDSSKADVWSLGILAYAVLMICYDSLLVDWYGSESREGDER